jgi:hypothetical protein
MEKQRESYAVVNFYMRPVQKATQIDVTITSCKLTRDVNNIVAVHVTDGGDGGAETIAMRRTAPFTTAMRQVWQVSVMCVYGRNT